MFNQQNQKHLNESIECCLVLNLPTIAARFSYLKMLQLISNVEQFSSMTLCSICMHVSNEILELKQGKGTHCHWKQSWKCVPV